MRLPTGLKSSNSVADIRHYADLQGHEKDGYASSFFQVLDGSMCVIREDLTDWLQRYLFSPSADVISPEYLLHRLSSGLWLSRLAYKLYHQVLVSGIKNTTQQQHTSEESAYQFLRGAVSNPKLKKLKANSLPPLPSSITCCAKLALGACERRADWSPQTELSTPDSNSSSSTPLGEVITRTQMVVKFGASHSGYSAADRWMARDNVSSFIHWCRDLGIPQTVLFETTGLVHRTEEKNVLLTLMELARIASRFGLADLPELVRMEREIDAIEEARNAQQSSVDQKIQQTDQSSHYNNYSSFLDPAATLRITKNSSNGVITKESIIEQVAAGDSLDNNGTIVHASSAQISQLLGRSQVDCVAADCDGFTCEMQTSEVASDHSKENTVPSKLSVSPLVPMDLEPDKEVRKSTDSFIKHQVEKKIAQCTCCSRLHMQRLEEGRYRLGSKVYYLRRFRAHVMVRVGGGWLTLDEFLVRYDPCRRNHSHRSSEYPMRNTNQIVAPTTIETSVKEADSSVCVSEKRFQPISTNGQLRFRSKESGSLCDLRQNWSVRSDCSSVSSNQSAQSVPARRSREPRRPVAQTSRNNSRDTSSSSRIKALPNPKYAPRPTLRTASAPRPPASVKPRWR